MAVVEGRGRRYALLSDEELMMLVGMNDAAAFAVVYERHGRAAYSLARRMMGTRQAAEDLAQDAFLKVWRSADAYRVHRGSVRNWVLAIVQNAGVDELRAGATRRRTRELAEDSAKRSQPSEAFAEAWGDSLLEELRRALGTLPPEQLEVVRLAYFSSRTHTEIADLLGLPLGTVKGRLRLALKRLRANLDALDAAEPSS